MLKALNAALIALSLICPGSADAQEQPDPDGAASMFNTVRHSLNAIPATT